MTKFTAAKAREIANGYDKQDALVKKFLKKIENAARIGLYETTIFCLGEDRLDVTRALVYLYLNYGYRYQVNRRRDFEIESVKIRW